MHSPVVKILTGNSEWPLDMFVETSERKFRNDPSFLDNFTSFLFCVVLIFSLGRGNVSVSVIMK